MRQRVMRQPVMRQRAISAGLLLAVATGGCGAPALGDLPLPGGAPDGPAYHVTAEFRPPSRSTT
jgi:phospholipid/cholesterol/gamma-HCH transport system substrate-binding protein